MRKAACEECFTFPDDFEEYPVAYPGPCCSCGRVYRHVSGSVHVHLVPDYVFEKLVKKDGEVTA